jgi:hypothetical protein
VDINTNNFFLSNLSNSIVPSVSPNPFYKYNVPSSNLNFPTDYAHSEFIRTSAVSYPNIEDWFLLIDDSYGISILAQSMIHAANCYANVAPAVQAAAESRLFDSLSLGRHILSYLCSSPDLIFDSVYVKAEHLARVDLNNSYSILCERIHSSSVLEPGEVGLVYKEVFFYNDTLSNEMRVGFSIISSSPSGSYRVIYFDSSNTYNFPYKLFDFMNSRYYPTNISASRDNLNTIRNCFSL